MFDTTCLIKRKSDSTCFVSFLYLFRKQVGLAEKMGMVQSCLGSFRALTWLGQPQMVNLEVENDQPKVYSWDKKPAENRDLVIENLNDETLVRRDIKGNQFMVRNCNNCYIFLMDYINCITIDDCKNCKIFIGPTKVSCQLFS